MCNEDGANLRENEVLVIVLSCDHTMTHLVYDNLLMNLTATHCNTL